MDLPETTKDVTVEWLNGVLHENGFLGKANVVSLTREPIGLGAGLLSDLARLTLTFDRDDTKAPKTMIAKLPPSYASGREFVMRANFFEREIRFYTEIAKKSPIRTPHLIYGAMDTENKRYVLLLEDCCYATPADQLRGLTYAQTKLITSKIAAFHARWWNSESVLSFPWLRNLSGMTANVDLYRDAWNVCGEMDDFRNAIPEGGWQMSLKIRDQLSWLFDNLPKDKLTIIHFDLRADNVFFDHNNREEPVIILDWATALRGRGATDLSFLLGTSMTTELRRQVEKDIVKSYREHLLSAGITDYSFKECWRDYLIGLLVRTGTLMNGFARLDRSDQRNSTLWSSMLHRWFSAIVDNDATSILPR